MSLFKSATVISAWTLLSRVTGLLREWLIAANFGATALTDAFNVAFRIPNLFRRFFADAGNVRQTRQALADFGQKGEIRLRAFAPGHVARHRQVHRQVHDAEEQHAALHQRIIALQDCLEHKAAKAGQGVDLLYQNGAAKQVAGQVKDYALQLQQYQDMVKNALAPVAWISETTR